MSFADFVLSIQMRDIITKLAAETVEKLRPKYRYAVVESWDTTTRKASVTYTGDSNPVLVNIGSIWPTFVGQVARIEGIGTDKFIADVFGTPPPTQDPGIATSGFVNPFAGSAAPSGWLICDGSAVSRTTYASLFAVIGTTYGSGNGSTTFNLPNLKGRFPVGRDAAQTEFDTLGKTGGAKSHNHTLSDAGQAGISVAATTTNQIQERRVSAPSYTNTHTINNANLGGGASNFTGTSTVGAALLGTTDTEATLPPYHVLNYIIKT
jgi:microcystin-dependent protein